MNIQDIRRENLRLWADKFGIPPKEKSYFSQLFGGASFGERAARRLEHDYKMGDGYLDKPIQPENVLRLVPQEKPKEDFSMSDEFIELLALYQTSSEKGRKFILKSARSADKITAVRWKRSVGDET